MESYFFSTDTSVALIIARTSSPSLRFIRLTEPVVIIDVTLPAALRVTSSDTTLSETIFSIAPCSRFRMLALVVLESTPRLSLRGRTSVKVHRNGERGCVHRLVRRLDDAKIRTSLHNQ